MSNNSLTDLTKFIEYSHTQAKDHNQAEAPINHPYVSHMITGSPMPEEQKFKHTNHSLSNALAEKAKELAVRTGEARDIVLSNLIKQNTAWLVLQNFLITDLLVKGSLLTFNFWMLNPKNNLGNSETQNDNLTNK